MKGIPVLILLLMLVVVACLPEPVHQQLFDPVRGIIGTIGIDLPVSQPSEILARVSGSKGSSPAYAPISTPTPHAVSDHATSDTAETVTNSTYTVGRGDTLSAVAAAFGVTVADVLKANDIANPNLILVGQMLLIPAPKER